MSNARETAKLIPRQFRKELLEDNVIYKAIVKHGDTHMQILVIIYENYIFNEGKPIDMNNPCLKCLGKILEVFNLILPELINLEKESKLLDVI